MADVPHSSKLEIDNFSHLTVLPPPFSVSLVSLECLVGLEGPVNLENPVSLESLVGLEDLVSLEGLVGLVSLKGQFGHPGQSYQSGQCCQSGHSLHDFTICIICALHNFQFYQAHLWTDFESCLFRYVNVICQLKLT